MARKSSKRIPSRPGGGKSASAAPAADPRMLEASKALSVAAEALNREDYARAKGIIEEVRRHLPEHPDALHLAGYLKLGEGQEEEGIRLIRKAIKQAPKVPIYHYNLGAAYFKRRELEKARDAFQAAVRLDPESRDAIDNLAITQHELKRLREAEALFERSVTVSPKDPKAWLNLAKIRMEVGKPKLVDEAIAQAAQLSDMTDPMFLEEVAKIYYGLGKLPVAEEYYRKALAKNPDAPHLLYGLGKVLAEQEQYEEAKTILQRALDRGAPVHNIEAALAEVYITSGEVARGRESLLQAFEHAGEDVSLLLDISQSFSLIGDFDLQEQVLERILEIEPDSIAAQVHLAFVPKRKIADSAVALMEKHIEDPAYEAKARTSMGFALGDHYRNVKAFDKAFRYYKRGNQLKGYRWDRAHYRQWVNRTLEIFDQAFFAERAGWGSDSRMPILIVGMPRSGTTLTEQIISSHSDVHGAGEFGGVAGLSAGPGIEAPRITEDANSILSVDADRLRAMTEQHLKRLKAQTRHGEHFVTNKMPHNFQQVGLFALEFPDAPIIHIRRDPRDNLLSIYFLDFGGYHPYAYDLKNLAFQYWEQERLMNHWKSVIPNPVFDLNYEELVGDLEGMIQRLADFLGLTVEDAMKKFYEQERQVQTASKWQVRQKLYTTSMARWKPYEKQLKPLFDALREFAPEGVEDEYGLFSM